MQAACMAKATRRPVNAELYAVDRLFSDPYDAVMRVHYVQHVPFEDVANIGAWAASRGHELTVTRAHEGEAFPKAADIHWLVIMGA